MQYGPALHELALTIEFMAPSVNGSMVVLGSVLGEVVGDGEGQVQAQAGDEDVAR